MKQHRQFPRKRHLAELLTMVFGLAGTAHAGTTFVTSCLDDGSPGTLRAALAIGGTVDAYTQSNCSTITLTQGEIAVPNDATLSGHNGAPHIIAAPGSRVLKQPIGGSGFLHNTLTVSDLTISGGRLYTAASEVAAGGCIFGDTLYLIDSSVSDCVAAGAGIESSGGAVAGLEVTLTRSRVENSAAYAAGRNMDARGGGVYAVWSMSCTDSTIAGNRVAADGNASGGGIFAVYNVILQGCTIDHNSAKFAGGVFGAGTPNGVVIGSPPNASPIIRNSTISSNTASVQDGGAVFSSAALIYNSTIAFNESLGSCGGVRSTVGIALQSTIVANNRSTTPYCTDTGSPPPLTGGANNLITVIGSAFVPADTLTADPQLTPLADHGGPTFTHGLSSSSPAVDRGNNALSFLFDQRGAGFDRVVGNYADIGAYERQADDETIFFGGFE